MLIDGDFVIVDGSSERHHNPRKDILKSYEQTAQDYPSIKIS